MSSRDSAMREEVALKLSLPTVDDDQHLLGLDCLDDRAENGDRRKNPECSH